jgi:hypothetical protein
MQDSAGFDVTGANDLALALFERAQHEMRCYTGDPIATANLAIDAAPEMVMPHVLKAWAYLLGTEPAGIASARRSIRRAAALTSNEREQAHVAALDLLVAGRWRDAGRALEDVNASHPLDVLALQAGHLIDFYTGDSRMLRDRIARALPAWDTEWKRWVTMRKQSGPADRVSTLSHTMRGRSTQWRT